MKTLTELYDERDEILKVYLDACSDPGCSNYEVMRLRECLIELDDEILLYDEHG